MDILVKPRVVSGRLRVLASSRASDVLNMTGLSGGIAVVERAEPGSRSDQLLLQTNYRIADTRMVPTEAADADPRRVGLDIEPVRIAH